MLTMVILLSQVGLPLHMHYCKGMLESVSVFFTSGCDEHEEAYTRGSCCMSSQEGCSAQQADCCDDQVAVLFQEMDSTVPQIDKSLPAHLMQKTGPMYSYYADSAPSLEFMQHNKRDTGEPIYILYHSLIFYA